MRQENTSCNRSYISAECRDSSFGWLTVFFQVARTMKMQRPATEVPTQPWNPLHILGSAFCPASRLGTIYRDGYRLTRCREELFLLRLSSTASARHALGMSTMLSDLPWHEPTSTGYGALPFCEGLAAHGGERDSTTTEVAEVLAMHDRDVVE